MTVAWTMEDIAREYRYGLTMVKKIVYRPDFPKPVRVFERAHPRWIAEEVREWFEARREAA